LTCRTSDPRATGRGQDQPLDLVRRRARTAAGDDGRSRGRDPGRGGRPGLSSLRLHRGPDPPIPRL